MYRTWQHLIIQNETGLQDPARIKRLSRASGHVGWLAVGGFFIAGIVAVFLAIFLFSVSFQFEDKRWSLLLSALVLLAMSGASFVSAWLFRKEMNLSPLRGFLKTPAEFTFVKGHLEDCHYVSGEKRHLDAIVVEGRALGPNGEVLLVREEFSPDIWNFTTPEAEASLQKGSDWFDKKGQRRLLPIPAYFICKKNRPVQARLVAIDVEYLASK